MALIHRRMWWWWGLVVGMLVCCSVYRKKNMDWRPQCDHCSTRILGLHGAMSAMCIPAQMSAAVIRRLANKTLTQCLDDIQRTPTVGLSNTCWHWKHNFTQQCCFKPAANKSRLTAVRRKNTSMHLIIMNHRKKTSHFKSSPSKWCETD